MTTWLQTKFTRRLLICSVSLAFGTMATNVPAHGFGQSLDLSLPLWLWIVGAGLSVILAFTAVIDFLPPALKGLNYPRITVASSRSPGAPMLCVSLWILRIVVLAMFVATIVLSLTGNDDASTNPAPTIVWVFFWVGLAFVSALIGDIWGLLNPLRSAFMTIEWLSKKLFQRPLSLNRRYPDTLGVWPAVILLFAFSWGEHLWLGAAMPSNLGIALLGYAALSFFGMVIYGREVWLQHGEVFAVVFGLVARFAPLELRITFSDELQRCNSTSCIDRRTECINGYNCLEHLEHKHWELNLRPPATGLLNERTVAPSMAVLVMLLLASVTFDGFIETSQWRGVVDSLLATDSPNLLTETAAKLDWDPVILVASGMLFALPLLFLTLLLACCWSMSRLSPGLRPAGQKVATVRHLASRYIQTLLPIGIAYHLAHYLTTLIETSQRVMALDSDSLNINWNPLDTGVEVAAEPVSLQIIWYGVVAMIVCGHIFSVFLAHIVTLDLYREDPSAIRRQLPLVLLMVIYTTCSIWLLAQPSYA